MDNKLFKNIISILVPILIIIVVGMYLVDSGIITDNPGNSNPEVSNTTLIIDYGNEVDTYNINISNATVFSVLIKASEEYDFQVTTKSFNENQSYIDSINSFANGQDDKYWMYYLNGNYGTVGADMQPVEDGDVIKWKFE